MSKQNHYHSHETEQFSNEDDLRFQTRAKKAWKRMRTKCEALVRKLTEIARRSGECGDQLAKWNNEPEVMKQELDKKRQAFFWLAVIVILLVLDAQLVSHEVGAAALEHVPWVHRHPFVAGLIVAGLFLGLAELVRRYLSTERQMIALRSPGTRGEIMGAKIIIWIKRTLKGAYFALVIAIVMVNVHYNRERQIDEAIAREAARNPEFVYRELGDERTNSGSPGSVISRADVDYDRGELRIVAILTLMVMAAHAIFSVQHNLEWSAARGTIKSESSLTRSKRRLTQKHNENVHELAIILQTAANGDGEHRTQTVSRLVAEIPTQIVRSVEEFLGRRHLFFEESAPQSEDDQENDDGEAFCTVA